MYFCCNIMTLHVMSKLEARQQKHRVVPRRRLLVCTFTFAEKLYGKQSWRGLPSTTDKSICLYKQKRANTMTTVKWEYIYSIAICQSICIKLRDQHVIIGILKPSPGAKTVNSKRVNDNKYLNAVTPLLTPKSRCIYILSIVNKRSLAALKNIQSNRKGRVVLHWLRNVTGGIPLLKKLDFA